MMLQVGDDGVVSSVNEEDLIYVDKNELEQFIESYKELEKENEQLKSFIKKLTNHNGEILLMNGYGYTKSYVEKLLNEKELEE